MWRGNEAAARTQDQINFQSLDRCWTLIETDYAYLLDWSAWGRIQWHCQFNRDGKLKNVLPPSMLIHKSNSKFRFGMVLTLDAREWLIS